MKNMSGATALVKMIEQHSVTRVFGLCGHTIVEVLDAIGRSDIEFIGVHHEQMAAHAADAYARLTGRVGLILVHLGPGLTNAATGIAEASLDGVPMVVISGNVQSYFQGQHAHMESISRYDAAQWNSLTPWVKRTWHVERAEALIPAISEAFRYATLGRPGPVHVDVAMDVFSKNVRMSEMPTVDVPSMFPGPKQVRKAADLLLSAKRPVIYAGADVARTGGREQLVRVAELLNAPVAYSTMGKTAIPDDHLLTVGLTGYWGTPAANEASRNADVILALGTQFGETDTSSWTPGSAFKIPPTRLIHVHSDPAELGRSYTPELPIQADADGFLTSLLAVLKETGGYARENQLPKNIKRLQDEFHDSLLSHQLSDGVPMRPERVLSDLRRAMPTPGVLIADTGWNKNGVCQQFPLYEREEFVVPGHYATMGFGPSAAIGAAVALPQKHPIALVGDGAFLTNMSVIQTAIEHDLSLTWIVMNNGTYGTISGMQEKHFGSTYGATFDASNIDYAAVARSLGAHGIRIERAQDFTSAVRELAGAAGPSLIDVPTTDDPVPTTGVWDVHRVFSGME